MFGFGVLYLWRSLNASHFCPQAYQFLARLIKEYSLVGGGPNSPAQEPEKASGSAFYSLLPAEIQIVLIIVQQRNCGHNRCEGTYSSAVNKLRIVRMHDFLAYLC